MCLSVQVILVLQFITAFFGGFHNFSLLKSLNVSVFSELLFAVIIPLLVTALFLPTLRKAKESKIYKNDLKRLKHNPQIFDALLAKQPVITESTEGLGITIGNPDAKHHLLKVCSPYCGPCSKAHPLIDELIDNNPDIRLQIIFSSYDNDYDVSTPAAKHMLAVFEKGDEKITRQALDDWYLTEKKDYNHFAEKYPLDAELKLQGSKIKAMRDWCDKMNVAYTPAFFINGYQLSDIYTVADLKYFLSV